ncbi:transglutaminase domain-containing protein [Taklimakanibacter lacteus]|uniref:transglutaminase domain-containing protein n=1 Tax=Taklimakanibacter lacteus TaxID=2268456 RepID=UPI000E67344E
MRAEASYPQQLDAFLARHAGGLSLPSVPAIYHAVRNLIYASDGNRDPAIVLKTGRGACTGKHILLRDLLRRVGWHADVEFAAGDFARGMPAVASMPEALARWVRAGGIRDFHCYVVWHDGMREKKLDATWPDALAPLGFPVNAAWDGSGDTLIALTPDGHISRAEDVIEHKAKLVATLSEQQRKDRRSFLELLTKWMPEEA